jgi:hypothetical protein
MIVNIDRCPGCGIMLDDLRRLRAECTEQREAKEAAYAELEAAEAREREAAARADRMSGYLGASITIAIPTAVADAFAKAIRVVLEPDVNGHVPSYARVLADRIAVLGDESIPVRAPGTPEASCP